MQPPAAPPDLRYRQPIPDAVIDPSLREPHTWRSHSPHNERRSVHYEQGRSAFAQDFSQRGPPRLQYAQWQTYPPPGSQEYHKHDYSFCPGEEPLAAAPLQGVRIENKVDTGVRHVHDRDHRATDRYARYNEETRVDWHRNEPRTGARWSPDRTAPDSSRYLPLQQQQVMANQTTSIPATSTWSRPSPIQHERRNVDRLHHRPTISPPPFPTHISQNMNTSDHLPVRRQMLPAETTDFSFPPPSMWAPPPSYGVQREPTASPPRRVEVDKSYDSYNHARLDAPYHRTQPFQEALPQPPIESHNTYAHPNESSPMPSPSDRNNGREEDENEIRTYAGIGDARMSANGPIVATAVTERGRGSEGDTARPSVVASVVDVAANTKRPAAAPSRATSSTTTTATRPGTAEPTTEATVVEDRTTKKKVIVEGVGNPEGKPKQQNARRSTKGMKRGSLLMEWKGPEPPVPLPPIKSWGRARQPTKAKTGTSKAWRVDVNAASGVETEAEAGSHDGSTPKVWDAPRGPNDYAESVNSSTKKRKGDHEGQSTSIGTTEEGSRAGGSQSQGAQKPRPKPRKKQKTSSPETEVTRSSSSPMEHPVRRGPLLDAPAPEWILQQGRIVEREPAQRLSNITA
ncbi:hypothetical protein EYR38_009128 [Pleurotus pulmonarius]|nr:hypothetical protein EYR38_009128 [Pleurotus pulmonarius]